MLVKMVVRGKSVLGVKSSSPLPLELMMSLGDHGTGTDQE